MTKQWQYAARIHMLSMISFDIFTGLSYVEEK
jgi:hypothetical protein